MLEDVADPFNQVVKRQTRPSHSTGSNAPETNPTGRLVIPVPSPDGSNEAPQPPGSRPAQPEAAGTPRITADPGPGAVTPPRWWANRGGGPRAVDPVTAAPDEDSQSRG